MWYCVCCFFKQKTAYDMRISDWSSDVCSSDLEIDGAIAATLTSLSPIRGIATVVQTGTSGYRKLIATGATEAGWVGETAARPATDTRSFAEIAPPSGALHPHPAASQARPAAAMFNAEDGTADSSDERRVGDKWVR